MGYIEPNSTIKLFKGCPCDPDYNHSIYFATEAEQRYYFDEQLFGYTFGQNTYQRYGRGSLKVSAYADEVIDCNYLMFSNDGYPSALGKVKRFYAFVTGTTYISNNCVRVDYVLDYIQTYMFDYQLGYCYVERTHSATDEPGDNLVPENVGGGIVTEYEQLEGRFSSAATSDRRNMCPFPADYGIAIFYSVGLEQTNTIYSNAFNGLKMRYYAGDDAPSVVAEVLRVLNEENHADDVLAVVQLPAPVLEDFPTGTHFRSTYYTGYDNYNALVLTDATGSIDPYAKDAQGHCMRRFGNYIPINNKLYTAPYFGLMCSSSNGDSNKYAFEYFNNAGGHEPNFIMYASVTPSPVVTVVPRNYKGLQINYEESLDCTDFPMCAYGSDGYKAWLAMNANSINASKAIAKSNLAQGIANSALAGAGAALGTTSFQRETTSPIPYYDSQTGMHGWINPFYETNYNFTGNPKGVIAGAAGAATGTANAIVNYDETMLSIAAHQADATHLPNKSRGNLGAYGNYLSHTVGFIFYLYHIHESSARIIDQYFTLYGYAMNQVMRPNLAVRPHWTYIKLAFANFESRNGTSIADAHIPADAHEALQKIYKAGITFWRNPSEVGNYNLDNRPARG